MSDVILINKNDVTSRESGYGSDIGSQAVPLNRGKITSNKSEASNEN